MNIPLYWTIEWIYHWIKRNIKFHSFSPYFILWKKNYKTLVLTIKPFCSSLSRSSWRNTKKFFRDLLRSTHQLKLKQKNNVCVYIHTTDLRVCVYMYKYYILYIYNFLYIFYAIKQWCFRLDINFTLCFCNIEPLCCISLFPISSSWKERRLRKR